MSLVFLYYLIIFALECIHEFNDLFIVNTSNYFFTFTFFEILTLFYFVIRKLEISFSKDIEMGKKIYEFCANPTALTVTSAVLSGNINADTVV